MPPVTDRVKSIKQHGPLWKGPAVDGITQSMLNRFICCRERFRIAYVLGLQPPRTFNHRTSYGDMWHACEEAFGAGLDWGTALNTHCEALQAQYPLSRKDIYHWMRVCEVQFGVYITSGWGDTPSLLTKEGKCLFTEKVFDVPLALPSGRTVRLRGKWDAVWMCYAGKDRKKGSHCVLQENKTKGDIKPEQLRRQLTFDLQTMLYAVAMDEAGYVPRGVLYNVVRRPLAGGKYSIVQHKATKNKPAETDDSYYDRLRGLIAEDLGHFFIRWDVPLQSKDVERFKQKCLLPLLEQVCDWYEFISAYPADKFWSKDTADEFVWPDSYSPGSRPAWVVHWMHPFGVYNVLDEGGSTDYDGYLADGNPTGLQRADRLFIELE